MENGHTNNISAVIFDLDGTILNTEQLTKNILKEFLAKYGKVQDNEKEKKRLGVTFKESSVAILKDYDLPLTPEQFVQEIIPMYHGKWQQAKPLPGATRLMSHLHKHGVLFGLASNSLRKNIDGKISHRDGWKERFAVILGSDQVKSGKPSPDIFLEAAKVMRADPAHCLVIEDSVVGVKAGKAAGMKVVAVPSLQSEMDSYSIADSILRCLLDFQPELWGLPQFDDWVENALPIEPIHLSGVYSNRLLQISADRLNALPDQMWGLYIGWVKFDAQKVLKAVISIGWSFGCYTSNRKIQACIIDGSDEDKNNAKMQLLLDEDRVVWIDLYRSTSGNAFAFDSLDNSFEDIFANMLKNLDILDEDKLTADAALNLPEYSHKSCKSFIQGDAVKDGFSLG